MSTLYELRYRPEAGSAVWSGWIDVGTSTSYRLEGLEAGTGYEVEVRAKGQTPDPLRASRWTRFAAPSAPTVSGVLAETATLTWNAVPGAAGYQVLRGGSVETSVGSDVTTSSVSGLTENTAYTFSIAVLNPDGDASVATAAEAVTTLPLATGGTISDINVGGTAYRVHTFTSTGESTFTLNATRDIEYLIVGGGGGGGNAREGLPGGGGGAGGLRIGSVELDAGTTTVTVGAGGKGAPVDERGGDLNNILDKRGSDGSASSFGAISAAGGGGGGANRSVPGPTNGRPGGSGGGAGGRFKKRSEEGNGGAGNTPATEPSQGFPGGSNTHGDQSGGNGGGGADGPGASATGDAGAAGGPGRVSTITAASITYATGGGGGTRLPDMNATGADGAANRGDGGGGGSAAGGGPAADGAAGGDGGSGVVILRYARSR